MSGTTTKVSGPLVVAEGLADANVSDVVRVGSQRLIGEILNMTGEIDKFKDSPTPAIILIPGRDGTIGLGLSALNAAVERAVGTNIL